MTTALDSVWNKPVASLTGMDVLTYTEIGEDDPRPKIECADGRDHSSHYIGFDEYLQFAVDRGDIDDKYLVDGWLNAAGLGAVRAAIQVILRDKGVLPADLIEQVTVDDISGDEPGIVVSVPLAVADPRTVEEAHDQVMWPFWAAMINMCDPGTFNWPYLWAHL